MTEQERNTIRFEAGLLAAALGAAKRERTAIERHISYFVNGTLLMFENYTALQQRIKDFDKQIDSAESAYNTIREVMNNAFGREAEAKPKEGADQ